MRSKILSLILSAVLLTAVPVHAEVSDYETAETEYEQQDEMAPVFQIDDGSGNTVNMLGWEDTLFIVQKAVVVRSCPGSAGNAVGEIAMGTQVQRTAVCDNGWSKISFQNGGDKISGYVPDGVMSGEYTVPEEMQSAVVKKDSEVLDYPGMKDGVVCGQVTASQEVQRTDEEDGIWSRVIYTNASGEEISGYVPTSVFEDAPEKETQSDEGEISWESVPDGTEASGETVSAGTESSGETVPDDTEVTGETVPDEAVPSGETAADASNDPVDAGIIHKSSGTGLFAKAVTEVPSIKEGKNGVQIGTPVAASSDATLVSLGTFRITHYCPCSICCGPWANGITSTGVTAVTNHTIAVNPSQIPYGSQVVINGQVYVAEDCGGAIKDNCIDIYVETHEEGESKGVFYTEVYLIQ